METFNFLVIDDDPSVRKLLGELLVDRREFGLLIAGDGKEAVRQFAENRIDMVLTDIHMPGFTGLELMADMKRLKLKPEIMVMTSNATPEDVETARKLGARSVLLKPFVDLEVLEAEINKALQAVRSARARAHGDGNGQGAPQPAAAAHEAPGLPAQKVPVRPVSAATPASPAKPAPWSVPKQNLWPARKPAAPAPIPVAAPQEAAAPEVVATSSEDDIWRADITGNDTPPAPPPRPHDVAAPAGIEATPEPPPVRPAPTARPQEPSPAARPVAPAPSQTVRPVPPAPTPAARPIPPAPPQAARPTPPAAPQAVRPTPPAPPQATRPAPVAVSPAPVQPKAARPSAAPPPEPHHAPTPVMTPGSHESPRPAAQPAPSGPAQSAGHAATEEAIPEIPPDLEGIFRMATSFDTGKMRMQVPIVCLQTWEEKGAIAALRRLASELRREFCVWSAARGLVKDGGQAMGETYRDAARALEFIKRQKNNGLYVLADFRPSLEDKTVVRVLREMVMDLETSRLMLVLTAPRLPAPPELAQACVSFDWPAGGGTDLKALYEEVAAEVAASAGRAIDLDPQARDLLLERVKEMPAGRARFEIARHLMASKPSH